MNRGRGLHALHILKHKPNGQYQLKLEYDVVCICPKWHVP